MDEQRDIIKIDEDACTGCGLCTHYGCVMELAPGRINQEFKVKLMQNKVENKFVDQRDPHPDHHIRKVPIIRLIGRLGLKEYEKEDRFLLSILFFYNSIKRILF